jgi:exoribonuclease R
MRSARAPPTWSITRSPTWLHSSLLARPLDREARQRGQTLYCPDERIRLYPSHVSEGVGSLLPQQDRPAVLWTFHLDESGRSSRIDVNRALVRSRQQLNTGMAAADIMLRGGVGLLRTMPPPRRPPLPSCNTALPRSAYAGPPSTSYPDFIRALNPRKPAHAALLTLTTQLFRGVHYVAISGEAHRQTQHHAVAAAYAHVTIPLRRMADRFANEIVLSLASVKKPPEWCLSALPHLPNEMKEGDRRADELERRIIDFVEAPSWPIAAETCSRESSSNWHKRGPTVQVREPAVLAPCEGRDLKLGSTVRVRLDEANPPKGRIKFQVEDAASQ